MTDYIIIIILNHSIVLHHIIILNHLL